MLLEIHIKANEVEPKNKILKDELEHKSSVLPDFINNMRGLLEEQRHEVEHALIGIGKST